MLTAHQEEVKNEAISILRRGNRVLIKGSAGVGKTYMTDQLIRSLISERVIGPLTRVLCTAPTNKAVAVLQSKISANANIEFMTTHSALKLKQKFDDNGDIYFQPNFHPDFPPLKDVGILMIDESSMISTEILEYVEEFANLNRTRVIFIGDGKQLNPVGEDDSPVFISDYPEVELTEIIRQGAGNPIIDLSRAIKDIWKRKDNYHVEDQKSIGYLYSNDREYILDRLADANGSDELKYLAWTNKEVDSINKIVRERIYGNPNKIEEGETIVFNKPYGDTYFTNQEIKINSCIVRDVEFKVIESSDNNTKSWSLRDVTFKVYICNGTEVERNGISTWTEGTIFVIHEDSERAYRELLYELQARAKNKMLEWKDFYAYLAKFADFKYNHALSVHKSQGSTYKKVVLNVKNLKINRNNRERQRLFYTGITRASDLLVLYNV